MPAGFHYVQKPERGKRHFQTPRISVNPSECQMNPHLSQHSDPLRYTGLNRSERSKNMAKLARRLTIISLSMALFAFMFAQLVVNTQPTVRHLSSGLVASCAPTGLNSCRPTF